MRLLSFTHTFAAPPRDGSQIRTWYMAQEFAERCSYRQLVGAANPDGLTLPWDHEVFTPTSPAHGLLARARRTANAVRTGVPASVASHRSQGLKHRVRELCGEGWPEVALAEELSAGAELDLVRALSPSTPTVLTQHSVHGIELDELPPAPHLILRRRLAREFERRQWLEATEVVVVTEEDGAELCRRYGERSYLVVPIGIDRRQFPLREGDPDGAPLRVATLANFRWQRNVEELEWLVSDVWPHVLDQCPGAILVVVGEGLSDAQRDALTRPSVEIRGAVDDVAAALADATVGVLPVIHGSGLRTRLLVCLGLGLPTVSTTLGVRGLADADAAIRIADSPRDLASATVELLRRADSRAALRSAGDRLATAHSWSAAADRLIGRCAELL